MSKEYSKSMDECDEPNNPIFGQVIVGNILSKDE